MKIPAFSSLLLLIARLGLAGTFIMAALPKIKAPAEFATAIEGYQVIHGTWTMWTAILLPWLELVIGLGLLLPLIRRASGLLITALMVSFIGLHLSAWLRGLDIACGCFGSEAEPSTDYRLLILRNLLLLVAAIYVIMRDLRSTNTTSAIAN